MFVKCLIVLRVVFGKDFELIVSSYVDGAMYPVDVEGSECWYEQYRERGCECYGGEARRAGLLDQMRRNTSNTIVTLDLGGYFLGVGSISNFDAAASTPIDVGTLNYRDFSPTSREKLQQQTQLNVSDTKYGFEESLVKEIPWPIVATNINATIPGVKRWQEIERGDSCVAVMALLDKDSLQVADKNIPDNFFIPVEEALTIALAEIAEHEIDATILMVWAFSTDDVYELLTAAQLAKTEALVLPDEPAWQEEQLEAAISYNQEVEALKSIAYKFSEISAIVVNGASRLGRSLPSDVLKVKSWLGQHAFIFKTQYKEARRGTNLTHCIMFSEDTSTKKTTQKYKKRRDYLEAAIEFIPLDCNHTEMEAARLKIDTLKKEIEDNEENKIIGYFSSNLEEPKIACTINTECAAGTFVADAVRWFLDGGSSANSELSSLPNSFVVAYAASHLGSGIRKGPVRFKDLRALLPGNRYADELVSGFEVPGFALRFLFHESISAYNTSNQLIFSSNCEINWNLLDGRPEVSSSYVNSKMLFVTSFNYRLVVPRSANNEDQFEYARSVADNFPLGLSLLDITRMYLETNHPSLETALDPVASYQSHSHIQRTPDVYSVHIAIFCGTIAASIQGEEMCDLALYTIHLINSEHVANAANGIPLTFIVPHILAVDCNSGIAFNSVKELFEQGIQVEAVIATCSAEVIDISAVDKRTEMSSYLQQQNWTKEQADLATDYLVISPLSTAPELTDRSLFPLVARIAASELVNADALVATCQLYQWSRIAVVHDDTIYGSSSAQAFINKLVKEFPHDADILGQGICLSNSTCRRQVYDPRNPDRPTGISFSFDDQAHGTLKMNDLIRLLDNSDARIIFLATYSKQQNAIFRAFASRPLGNGFAGFAWLLSAPFDTSLLLSDGTVDFNAVTGARGSLAFQAYAPSYEDDTYFTTYADMWASVSSQEACNGKTALEEDIGTPPTTTIYCDADGDPERMVRYGMQTVDSIFLLSNGLNAYLLENPEERHGKNIVGSEMYRVINELPEFDGVSGGVDLDEVGERKSDLELRNLQFISRNSDGDEQPETRRRLLVPLSSVWADYVKIGNYGIDERLRLEGEIVFPGGQTIPPSDGSKKAKRTSNSGDRLPYWLIILICVFCMLVFGCCACFAMRLYKRQLLDRIVEQNIDLYEVIADFDPEHALTPRNENEKSHMKLEFIHPQSPPSTIEIVPTSQKLPASISSENIQDGRELCISIDADPNEEDSKSLHSNIIEGLPQKWVPEDLRPSCLPLRKGMLVRVVHERIVDNVMWCYGVVVLDKPILTKQKQEKEAVLSPQDWSRPRDSDGWFPGNKVQKKAQAQNLALSPDKFLNLLQPPTNWQAMEDPRKVDLIELDRFSKEYLSVQDTFDKGVDVLTIFRVQNLSLWQCYVTKRAVMLNREGSTSEIDDTQLGSSLERLSLYHGAPSDAVQKIVQNGFNRSFCGRNANRFGRGVYFARDPSYSTMPKYAVPDPITGHQHAFVCRLMVGAFCLGSENDLAPSVRDPDSLDVYDTTVDDLNSPSIFVAYNDYQAYPSYLVRFRQSQKQRQRFEKLERLIADGSATPRAKESTISSVIGDSNDEVKMSDTNIDNDDEDGPRLSSPHSSISSSSSPHFSSEGYTCYSSHP